VIEINEALEGEPDLVNSDPYGTGWIIKVKISDNNSSAELMNPEEYTAFLDE
jgi:glycine cleavage system H protein